MIIKLNCLRKTLNNHSLRKKTLIWNIHLLLILAVATFLLIPSIESIIWVFSYPGDLPNYILKWKYFDLCSILKHNLERIAISRSYSSKWMIQQILSTIRSKEQDIPKFIKTIKIKCYENNDFASVCLRRSFTPEIFFPTSLQKLRIPGDWTFGPDL